MYYITSVLFPAQETYLDEAILPDAADDRAETIEEGSVEDVKDEK